MSWYLGKFLKAWLFTVAIETLVVVLVLLKFNHKQAAPLKLIIGASIAANSLTLPYVWFVFPYLFLGRYSTSLIISELFAWLAEAIFYKMFLQLSWKKTLIVSFIANALSLSLGYIIGNIFHVI